MAYTTTPLSPPTGAEIRGVHLTKPVDPETRAAVNRAFATHHELPAAMKRRIDPLKAVHVYLSKYSPRELKPLNEESLKALPPPGIHPLVRVHPENGRKALFLNPVRIESIIGMPDTEALDLVAELMAHATQKKYEYRHPSD